MERWLGPQKAAFTSEDVREAERKHGQRFTHDINSATHGDPLSARWDVVIQDGVPVFLASKNLSSPGLADEICAEAIPWLASAMGMMGAAFPQENDTGAVNRSGDITVQ
jgi:hypothetical protein